MSINTNIHPCRLDVHRFEACVWVIGMLNGAPMRTLPILLSLTFALTTGCSDDDDKFPCGEGTIEQDGECVGTAEADADADEGTDDADDDGTAPDDGTDDTGDAADDGTDPDDGTDDTGDADDRWLFGEWGGAMEIA